MQTKKGNWSSRQLHHTSSSLLHFYTVTHFCTFTHFCAVTLLHIFTHFCTFALFCTFTHFCTFKLLHFYTIVNWKLHNCLHFLNFLQLHCSVAPQVALRNTVRFCTIVNCICLFNTFYNAAKLAVSESVKVLENMAIFYIVLHIYQCNTVVWHIQQLDLHHLNQCIVFPHGTTVQNIVFQRIYLLIALLSSAAVRLCTILGDCTWGLGMRPWRENSIDLDIVNCLYVAVCCIYCPGGGG